MIEIKPLGDCGIRVSFGEEINETIHRDIQQFIVRLTAFKLEGIVEWVPSYHSIAIYYRPEEISYKSLAEKVKMIYSTSRNMEPFEPIVYEIPVYYGGETGPDLSFIAHYHGISEEEAIALHSHQEYLIYMMGFVPGFPYLGGLSQTLAVPRLEHPRASVAAGSVGIGGNQTGIYPSEVPSGWRILGNTPIQLFNIENTPPVLFTAGNYIKFYPVDMEEYLRIKQLVEDRAFKVKTYKKGENHEGN